MSTREDRKTELGMSIQNVINDANENNILNLIRISVQAHRQGSGLVWSETEEIVKSKFTNAHVTPGATNVE